MSTFYHLYNLTKDEYIKNVMNFEKNELQEFLEFFVFYQNKTADKIVVFKSKDYLVHLNIECRNRGI